MAARPAACIAATLTRMLSKNSICVTFRKKSAKESASSPGSGGRSGTLPSQCEKIPTLIYVAMYWDMRSGRRLLKVVRR